LNPHQARKNFVGQACKFAIELKLQEGEFQLFWTCLTMLKYDSLLGNQAVCFKIQHSLANHLVCSETAEKRNSVAAQSLSPRTGTHSTAS
jgi:hypothetical protein